MLFVFTSLTSKKASRLILTSSDVFLYYVQHVQTSTGFIYYLSQLLFSIAHDMSKPIQTQFFFFITFHMSKQLFDSYILFVRCSSLQRPTFPSHFKTHTTSSSGVLFLYPTCENHFKTNILPSMDILLFFSQHIHTTSGLIHFFVRVFYYVEHFKTISSLFFSLCQRFFFITSHMSKLLKAHVFSSSDGLLHYVSHMKTTSGLSYSLRRRFFCFTSHLSKPLQDSYILFADVLVYFVPHIKSTSKLKPSIH